MNTNKATRIHQTWLVAHDFSACAETAADLALEDMLATRRGGRILLLHAVTLYVPPPSIEGMAIDLVAIERKASADALRRLEEVAQRLRALVQQATPPIDVVIDTAVRVGSPVEEVLAEAQSRQVDRIIVGTHGRSGAPHLFLGSVAERIARRSPVPVLIAHAA